MPIVGSIERKLLDARVGVAVDNSVGLGESDGCAGEPIKEEVSSLGDEVSTRARTTAAVAMMTATIIVVMKTINRLLYHGSSLTIIPSKTISDSRSTTTFATGMITTPDPVPVSSSLS